MGRLDVQFLDEGLHRVLFDAMPLPVFVVDNDINILEYNAAGARLLVEGWQTRKHRRKRGRVAVPARDRIAGRMWPLGGVFSLRAARGGERGFPGTTRDAPMGGDGIEPARQAGQGQSARQLPTVQLWQKRLRPPGSRRVELTILTRK